MKNQVKFLLIIALCFIGAAASAQEKQPFSDEIIISYNDSMEIKIQIANYSDKRSYRSINDAFLKFQNLFGHLIDRLHDYQYYSITYLYGKQITTNRLSQEEIYYISEDNHLKVVSFRSTLTIIDNNFRIEVEFHDIAQLLDPNIQNVINTAIDELPRRNIQPSTIRYVLKDDTLIKPANHIRRHGSSIDQVGTVMGAHFGFTDGLISYGLSTGIGYMHQVKNVNRSFSYIGVSSMSTYNMDEKQEEWFTHICLGFKYRTDLGFYRFNWFGYEIGFPIFTKQRYFGDQIGLKFGMSYQLSSNLWFKMEVFDVKDQEKPYTFFGIDINI